MTFKKKKRIRKTSQITVLNDGVIVDSMESNSLADAPSINAVNRSFLSKTNPVLENGVNLKGEKTNGSKVPIALISKDDQIILGSYLTDIPMLLRSKDKPIWHDGEKFKKILVEGDGAAGDTLPVGSGFLYTGDDPIPDNYEVANPPFSNINLLINPCFRIWQRGESFTGDSSNPVKYFADRWIGLLPSGSYIRINNDRNSLVIEKTNTNQTTVRQYIELTSFDSKFYIDKAFTLSIQYHSTVDMNITVGVGTQRSTAHLKKGENYIHETYTLTSTDIEVKSGIDIIDCLIFNNSDGIGTVAMRYAKLELGEIATPFVPRSYAQDLSECKYYYRHYNAECLGAYLSNANGLGWFILEDSIRIKPSIKGEVYLFQPFPNKYDRSSTLSVYSDCTGQKVPIIISGLVDKQLIQETYTYIYSCEHLELDAEIY